MQLPYTLNIYVDIYLHTHPCIYIHTHIRTNISSSCYNLLMSISSYDKNAVGLLLILNV